MDVVQLIAQISGHDGVRLSVENRLSMESARDGWRILSVENRLTMENARDG